MRLFETTFRDGYDYFERYFNTETSKSESHKIDSKYEYFVPYSFGEYKLITDQNLRLTRLEGTSKQAKDQMGVVQPVYKHIRDTYWKNGTYNLSPRIAYLDIETRAKGEPDPLNAPEQITLIQVLDSKTNQAIVLGLRPWEPEEDYKLECNVKYVHCQDEISLLETFVKVFRAINPVVVYAWNGDGFDFPYLYNRMKNLGLNPNDLSNYGSVKLDIVEDPKTHRNCFKLNSPGHHFLDLMEVYKRFVLSPRASYALDSIAEVELNSHKVDHSEFPTFDSFYTGEAYTISDKPYSERIREQIRQRYIKKNSLTEGTQEYNENMSLLLKDINFQFVYYGVIDIVLLKKIDEKRNLSKIIVNISKTMGVNYKDVLGTVKPWSQYISNVALKEGLVMPRIEQVEATQYEGAFVRHPVKGKHKWVLNFDVNSMYPQFSIAGFGMSPENLVPMAKLPLELRGLIQRYFANKSDQEILDIPETVWNEVTPILVKHNLCLTANGTCYKRDSVGIIPRLVNQIYDGRKLDKKEMFKYEQEEVEIEKTLEEGIFGNKELEENIDILNIKDLNSYLRKSLESLLEKTNFMVDRLNTEQLTKKILINALYGATGNAFFPLYNKDFASGITANGRIFIQQTANMIRQKFQELIPWSEEYIVYGDTDSVYYTVEPFVNKYLETHPNADKQELTDFCLKFANKVVQKVIDDSIDLIAKRFNCQDKSRMAAKVEVVCDVMINCAKKKYYARVLDAEGVRYDPLNPHIKIMGLELAKSTTPQWVKDTISQAVPILFDKNESDLKNWIKTIKNSYLQASLWDISQVCKTNNLKYNLGDKGVPFGAKMALVYNKFIKDNNLQSSFRLIQEREKFRGLRLVKNNPFGVDIIGYCDLRFAEKYLKPYIDYDAMFDNTFLSALKLMTDCMDYDVYEKVISIDEDW